MGQPGRIETSRQIDGQCWVCDERHWTSEFPRVAGVPITFGYMGFACRDVYESLSDDKQNMIRARGHARFEQHEREKAAALSRP